MEICRHTLYLIRHGETEWNAQKRLQGRRDIPLNEIGRQQANNAGACLTWLNLDTANLDFLASPLVRAQETMRSVRHQLGLDPTAYRTDDRLMEISFGKWEGLSWQHIQAEHPKEYRAHLADPLELAIPGGESWRMVFTRVAAVLKSLERDTLIVAHAGILRACLKLQGGVDERLAPNLDIPQNRILIMRNGHFAWLQANSTPDGSQAMLSQTSPG